MAVRGRELADSGVFISGIDFRQAGNMCNAAGGGPGRENKRYGESEQRGRGLRIAKVWRGRAAPQSKAQKRTIETYTKIIHRLGRQRCYQGAVQLVGDGISPGDMAERYIWLCLPATGIFNQGITPRCPRRFGHLQAGEGGGEGGGGGLMGRVAGH